MRVLLCHNYYQQPGGEDAVFADETALLQSRGHAVAQFTLHNDAVADYGKLSLAVATLWNRKVAGQVRKAAQAHGADVVHFHNTFPLLSPASYYAARRAGAAVVQTLHNFRLICPGATLFRNGSACEQCVGKRFAAAAIKHACYRDNRAASAATATMLAVHRMAGTWHRRVDAFIALTDFARRKFIDGGLPAGKLHVKPNFVDPIPQPGAGAGNYVLFVGRLTEEKGLRTLIAAWNEHADLPRLIIAGQGPLAAEVAALAASNRQVEYLGPQPREKIDQLLADAACLVFPSTWYEGLPKTILESFALGTPVVASRLGSMIELIEPNHAGVLFEPGDSDDLAAKLRAMLADSAELSRRRANARAAFLAKYAANANYAALTDIYRQAIEGRQGRVAEARQDNESAIDASAIDKFLPPSSPPASFQPGLSDLAAV